MSNVFAGLRSRRASRIVDTIATTINGPITSGCSDPTHCASRATKNAFVYGGGSAASDRLADGPQIPTTHIARPAIMPNPQDISIGPSDRSAAPNENRLVRKWNPNTAISTTPKITQVVGCVNAAPMESRKTADRAPHDVRDAPRKGSSAQSRNSIRVLSR